MPLGTDYAGQACSLARTLEIVGERWTLLILRDLFFGVRRFSDLQRHLDVPRAVLSARIASLVERGLVERRPYAPGRDELLLTERGVDLWPAVHSLMQWGENHCSPGGARRVFIHVGCGTAVGADRRLPRVRRRARAAELQMRRGRARAAAARRRGHARAARSAAAADPAAVGVARTGTSRGGSAPHGTGVPAPHNVSRMRTGLLASSPSCSLPPPPAPSSAARRRTRPRCRGTPTSGTAAER